MSKSTEPTRYHPALVVLHWLMALLIIVALVMGGFMLSETPNTDPSKLYGLRMHMIFGSLILVLVLIRLVVRLRTDKPPHADIGNPLLNKAANWAHWAFYALIILVAGSGIGISIMAGLPQIVFFGSGDSLPPDFWAYPPRYAHEILTKLLGLLIVGHVAAALYHQIVRKDGLLKRMTLGKRS